MITLTPEQRQELDRFALLLAEEQGWGRDAYHAALEVFARDGWDDPRMAVYDALDPRRPAAVSLVS